MFGSLVEVQAAIKRFITKTNGDPKPFVWTADPDRIIQAAKRGHQALDWLTSNPLDKERLECPPVERTGGWMGLGTQGEELSG